MRSRFAALFRLTEFRVSVLLSLILAFLCFYRPPILELFEMKAYDMRLRWRGLLPTTGQVVIVAIDEKSLQELGQWPWSRILMAQLIEALDDAGARVIGLDIIWPEPEQRLGILDLLYGQVSELNQIPFVRDLQGRFAEVAREHPEMDAFLRAVRDDVSPDGVLAKSILNANRVVLGNFFFMDPEEIQNLSQGASLAPPLIHESEYPLVRKAQSLGDSLPLLFEPYRMMESVAVIAQSARAFGYFNMLPDPDGVVRSIPLVMDYQGHLVLPLSLQTLRYSNDPSHLILYLEEYGVEGVQWKKNRIPTSELGLMFINYRGDSRTFNYVSAVDVIRDRVSRGEIADKIVLVGVVATGIYDLRVTPLDNVFPGVEIHANIIDNILQGDYVVRPDWTTLIDIFVLISLGVALGWIFPRLRPVHGAIFMLLAFGGHLYGNAWLLMKHGYWLNVIYPSIMIPTSYLGVTIFKYVHEEKEKRMIKGAFQFYVTPTVVNQILEDPNALRLGGQRRALTVLFSDIRGFTSISQTLEPEGLVHLLNDYLTAMTDVVFRHGGTLDKYIGDAIMAIYGAPLPQTDHPARACLTALDMIAVLQKLNAQWQSRATLPIEMGIGINTGEMVVGNMGSERRFDYTVVGDHVNLASRLEALNKQYGTYVIISEFTYHQVHELFLCRELDYVRVRGRVEPVRIYEILARRGDASDQMEWLDVFDQALLDYRKQRWDHAAASFERVLTLTKGDPPSRLYIDRCKVLQANSPPSGWDGVYEWGTK